MPSLTHFCYFCCNKTKTTPMERATKNLPKCFVLLLLLRCFSQTSSAPTAIPTSIPTAIPTANPTFGPASSTIVHTIIFNTLAGIIFLLLFYFYSGYYLYERDVLARLEKHSPSVLATSASNPVRPDNLQTEESPLLGDNRHML